MSYLLVHVLFVFSGASALVYEVLWERSLRLSFGVSTYSVALVTASFMAGLSVGYRWGRSPRLLRFHPLRVYAAAEAGIALYALAFPWLHAGVDRVYVATGGSLAARGVLAFALLLPPTALMGITLPVVARGLAGRRSTGAVSAGLFAANTAGAVAGALGAGWFLLRLYGAAATNGIATVTNLGVAAFAFVLAASARGSVRAGDEGGSLGRPEGAREIAVALAALVAGIHTMGLQVIWNRTLVCVVENNTTSFATILAAVLIGSAGGGALYALIAGRRGGSGGRLLTLFLVTEAFLGLYSVGSIGVLNRLYDVAGNIEDRFLIQDPATLCLVRLLVVLIPVAPAAAAGAFLLPLLVDMLGDRSAGDRARSVSTVFAADAVGSVLGALGAGFALIPLLGLGRSLVALALVGIGAAGAVLLAFRRDRRSLVIGLPALAAVAVAAVGLLRPLTLLRWYDGHERVEGELLFYREGTFGTVSVFRVDGRKELLINCIEEVPDHRDALLLFKLLGHTPMLLHGAPKAALVNALGGGVTLGAVARHGVPVEAVDLVPEVREAMSFFREENGDALSRTNWTLVHDDGRNYLRLSPRTYDVITVDATHPAAGESWPLYTGEYYRIVREHLPESGVFAQWLPLHNMSEDDFLAALRTFREGFADVLVMFVQRYCILIGSPGPIRPDPAELSRRIAANAEVAADLRALGIESGEDLLRYVVLESAGVDRLAGRAGILSDDHASVEFAELDRIGVAETFPLNLALLLRGMDPEALARATGVELRTFWARQRLLRAQLRSREPTLESAFAAVRELEEARAMAPNDADVGGMLETVRGGILRSLARDYEALLARPDLEPYVEIFEYARETWPDDAFVNQVLGAALLRLERFADAIPPLERAATLRPGDVTFQSNLVYAYERAGRLVEALEMLGRLQDLDPQNPVLGQVRARIERRMSEKEKSP